MIFVQDVHKHFGGLHAVDRALFEISEGSITGLISANGAGKTSLFNAILGVLKLTQGKVLMAGEDITGLPPHELSTKGLLRTLLNTVCDAIVRLNQERGNTFCMIKHDMDFIGRLFDPVICMAEGKVLAQGTLDEIKANEQVIEAYLGTGLKNKVAS